METDTKQQGSKLASRPRAVPQGHLRTGAETAIPPRAPLVAGEGRGAEGSGGVGWGGGGGGGCEVEEMGVGAGSG